MSIYFSISLVLFTIGCFFVVKHDRKYAKGLIKKPFIEHPLDGVIVLLFLVIISTSWLLWFTTGIIATIISIIYNLLVYGNIENIKKTFWECFNG